MSKFSSYAGNFPFLTSKKSTSGGRLSKKQREIMLFSISSTKNRVSSIKFVVTYILLAFILLITLLLWLQRVKKL